MIHNDSLSDLIARRVELRESLRRLRGGLKDALLYADEVGLAKRAQWLADAEDLRTILTLEEADLLETERRLVALGYDVS